jgi:hypothetical protein
MRGYLIILRLPEAPLIVNDDIKEEYRSVRNISFVELNANALSCGSGHFFPSVPTGHSGTVGAGGYSGHAWSSRAGSSDHPPGSRRYVW